MENKEEKKKAHIDVLKALEEFMETEKGEFNTNAGINIDDFFNGYRN